jgi:hypothetical protein
MSLEDVKWAESLNTAACNWLIFSSSGDTWRNKKRLL